MILYNLLSIFASGCAPKKSSLLGLPTWYEYLNGVKEPGPNGACSPAIGSLNDIWLILLAVIDILLRIAAILAVAFIVYAGYKYTTSQGDSNKTAEAKDTIINALIGLAIAVSASLIVTFFARSIK